MSVLARPDAATPARVALVSVHTGLLDQPGVGDGGGLNVYVLEVARRLAAHGIEVDVYTRRTAPSQARVRVVEPRLRVRRVTAGPAAGVPRDQLPRHLDAFARGMLHEHADATHDLVHGHYWLSGWVAREVAAHFDIPFVQTFHTLGALKNATLAPGDVPESDLRLAVERRVAREADRVVGLTCGEARILHETLGLSGARIAVVPAGADLEMFHPTATEPRPHWTAGDQDGPTLLFAGRLQPLKGPDVAVRTLAYVRRELPDARLRIVGGASGAGAGRTDPDQLAKLAAEVGVADAVQILPAVPQPELAEHYRAADVVLTPSRSETFGLVALETQASGTPVVAADVSGLRYVVSTGGVRVAGHDPADHAAAVLDVLTTPGRAAELGRRGRAFAEGASWDRTVERLLGVYGSVCEQEASWRQATAS